MCSERNAAAFEPSDEMMIGYGGNETKCVVLHSDKEKSVFDPVASEE